MGRNKDELIKLAEKITGQECKDVLTKKDALKKIACHYLGEEKEFASIADCLECIVEYGATGGGSGGGGIELIELNATENNIYEPAENQAYSRVTVNVRKPIKLYAYVSSNVDVPHPIYLYKSTVPSSDFTGQTTCFRVDETKLNLVKTNFYALRGDNPSKIDDNSFYITGSTFIRNKSYDIVFSI